MESAGENLIPSGNNGMSTLYEDWFFCKLLDARNMK